VASAPKLVSAVKVYRERYQIHPVTLQVWMNDPNLNFPKPTKIRGRNYFLQHELDEHDQRMIAAGRRATVSA
jgi:hypothetical protein